MLKGVKAGMIQSNKAMKLLFQQHKINVDDISADNAYPIWKKRDQAGRPYWGVSDFWHLDQNGVSASEDLSRLEWDGNEVHLDAYAEDQIPGILIESIRIIKAWMQQLEHEEPDMLFLILASYDDGGELVNREDFPDGCYAITFRFWAARGENTVVNLASFEDWEQPALLAVCNKCTRSL